MRAASPVVYVLDLPEAVGSKVTVLTASSGTELASWDEEAEHGLFTNHMNHMLDALYGNADADGDMQVTAGEASAYLKRYMTRAARRLFARHQNATLLGAAETVLSAAAGGVFPERPALGVVVGGAAATAAPDEVQRDLLLLGMKEANARNEHEKVLAYAGSWRNWEAGRRRVAGPRTRIRRVVLAHLRFLPFPPRGASWDEQARHRLFTNH